MQIIIDKKHFHLFTYFFSVIVDDVGQSPAMQNADIKALGLLLLATSLCCLR